MQSPAQKKPKNKTKTKTKKPKKQQTKNTEATRQQKLQISNYNLKYPVISNFTVF